VTSQQSCGVDKAEMLGSKETDPKKHWSNKFIFKGIKGTKAEALQSKAKKDNKKDFGCFRSQHVETQEIDTDSMLVGSDSAQKATEIECCVVPVMVCKVPQKTAGLGDNISATGLAYHKYLAPGQTRLGQLGHSSKYNREEVLKGGKFQLPAKFKKDEL